MVVSKMSELVESSGRKCVKKKIGSSKEEKLFIGISFFEGTVNTSVSYCVDSF